MADLHHSEAAPSAGAFRTAVTLAQLLQRVDATPAQARSIGADQYRALVQRLGVQLGTLPPGPDLQKLLAAFPAAATVYENLHYGHAGLCRAPLDQSLNSELAARQLIERVQGTRA
jgi:hypothetical protein